MVGRVAQLTANSAIIVERVGSLSAVVSTTLPRAEMVMGVRAGEVNTRASEVVTIAMMGAILTAPVIAVATNVTALTKTPKMVPPTAFGGSRRTRTGMAAVSLRLGAEMALAVTGVLVSPLRLVVFSKPIP